MKKLVVLLAAALLAVPSFGPQPDDCPQWVCVVVDGRELCYCAQ